jgi:hypothetical protein
VYQRFVAPLEESSLESSLDVSDTEESIDDVLVDDDEDEDYDDDDDDADDENSRIGDVMEETVGYITREKRKDVDLDIPEGKKKFLEKITE